MAGIFEERIFDLAEVILDCVCLRLGQDRCPSRTCVYPGVEIAHDNCCSGETQGQLTINLVRLFSSRSFPVESIGVPNNCNDPLTVAEFNVEITRCAPGPDNQGNPPTCEQQENTARQNMRDAVAVRDGVTCCLRADAMEALLGPGVQWAFGDQRTVGPAGGCVGSALTVLIATMTCTVCPP